MKKSFKAAERVRAYGYANRGDGKISIPNCPGDRMDVKGNALHTSILGIVTVICDDGVQSFYHASQLRRL